MKYKGYKGDILFTPSTLRFDMFYPIITETKVISAKNKFPTGIQILNVWSPQSYILADLTNSLVKPTNKSSVVEVTLDLDPEPESPEEEGLTLGGKTFGDENDNSPLPAFMSETD